MLAKKSHAGSLHLSLIPTGSPDTFTISNYMGRGVGVKVTIHFGGSLATRPSISFGIPMGTIVGLPQTPNPRPNLRFWLRTPLGSGQGLPMYCFPKLRDPHTDARIPESLKILNFPKIPGNQQVVMDGFGSLSKLLGQNAAIIWGFCGGPD